MLSALQVDEQFELDFSGAVSLVETLEFPTDDPYEFSWLRSTWTAGPAILIPACTVRDEQSNLIVTIGLIPWQFAATTIERITVQTPHPTQTNLFGPALSGFIVSGLTVYNGWTLSFTDFLGGAGVTFFGTAGFTRVRNFG